MGAPWNGEFRAGGGEAKGKDWRDRGVSSPNGAQILTALRPLLLVYTYVKQGEGIL